MTEISGLNQGFTINGRTFSFEEIDKNKDGVISEEEYNSLLNEMQPDTVDITSGVEESEKSADEDKAAYFEQEVKMEEALDNIKKQISIDFCGENSKYIADIAFDLKDYLDDFKNSYTGDISKMAAAFEEALPAKYEELKASYLSADPKNVKSEVLDGIIEKLDGIFDEEKIQTLGQILETEADNFISGYNGDNLEADLKSHLEEFIKSDYEKLEGAIEEYQTFADSLGAYVDSGEFEKLKNEAKKLLQEALDKGISLTNGDSSITNNESLEAFIESMTDVQTLKAGMENLIQSISKETLLERISSGDVTSDSNTDEAAEKEVSYDIYQVSAEGITDPFAKKIFASADDMKEALLRDTTKNQFKLQITEQMAAQGLSFNDIEAVFNNTYNDSVNEYIDNLASSISSNTKSKSVVSGIFAFLELSNSLNINDFVQLFNNNMVKNLEDMNKSDIDFDIQNIDMTSPIAGMIRSGRGVLANKALRELKPNVEAEAQRMCQANNVTYDSQIFNQIYSSSANSDFNGVEEFLINFKTEYSNWVYSNRPASSEDKPVENGSAEDSLSVYQVNPDSIAALKNGKNVVIGESGAKSVLTSDAIVNQFKSQIIDQMAAQGLSFSDIETVFNNVYNDSVNEYVDTLDLAKTSSTRLKKLRLGTIGQIDMQDFIAVFNNNMAKAIEEINKSDTDFDIQNIDMTSPIASMICSGRGPIANKALRKFMPYVEAEAQRMCQANNITYDSQIFNQIYSQAANSDFNNVKEFLINFKTEYSIWVYDQKAE